MDENDGLYNAGGGGWTPADADDYDSHGANVPNGGYAGTSTNINLGGILSTVERGLGQALQYSLARDQLEAQASLARMGRGYLPLGYVGGPAYGAANTPEGMIRMLMLFGLGFMVMKAVR